MATYKSLYTCYEVQVDENDNFLKEYKTKLPHAAEIIEYCCKKWNEMHCEFLAMINAVCDNRIESCRMTTFRDKDNTTLSVNFVAKHGKQLAASIKNEIDDFMSAQFSDGWGEGIFGAGNIMTAKDGTHYYID